jgi:hypothetical protein|tara:strand:+ start:1510 stop:1752 length:243 start_codon:yes stop_codon:yes gene_type:complete
MGEIPEKIRKAQNRNDKEALSAMGRAGAFAASVKRTKKEALLKAKKENEDTTLREVKEEAFLDGMMQRAKEANEDTHPID